MRKRNLFLLFFLFISILSYSQTFCLRLSEVSNDGSDYIVKIEMQGDETFTLGSGNLQFFFSNDALSSPVLFSSPMVLPNYFTPTVTLPLSNKVSFNIELLVPNVNALEIVAAPGWTELGQISFTIDDPGAIGPFEWSYTGSTTETVQFLGDDFTQIFATDPSCLIFSEAGSSNVRLTQVEHIAKTITIKNFGDADEDISSWRLCSNFNYTSGGIAGDSQITLLAGDYNLSPNEEVTVMWTPPTGLRPDGDDVGLYLANGGFGSAAAMVDFTQYKSPGNGRESVAVAKGIWSTGDFVDGESPFNYVGDGIETGVSFWEGTLLNTCATDFNADGTTDGDDFSIFLGNFGLSCTMNDCPTDLNDDNVTDGDDFSIFLGNFGLDCTN